MTKQYSGLIKVTTILLAVVIMIISLYALVNGVELFASAPTVTSILFIAVFTLIGIERVKAKDKYGHLYLTFTLVMAIILGIKVYD